MYTLTPLANKVFGAEIRNISLSTVKLNDELIQRIKQDLAQHRLLIFKGQGMVTGDRQVELSKKLGRIESTFYKHPRSPHPDVFRVSNLEEEGCTSVGRTGWHLDGTFQARPFKYQTMHFHSVIQGGDTLFIPLREFYERQDVKTQERWSRLWFATGRDSAHPMVYVHPIRADTTMLFHCGRPFCAGWLEEAVQAESQPNREPINLNDAKVLTPTSIQDELTESIWDAFDSIGHRQEWAVGDFAIVDNLGLVHYADEGTQQGPEAGLRVLHRTTIQGDTAPFKADGRSS
eukprot:CAMPEP_0198217458 /NCGR_PEP_ID=MMETSP1445-20131203/63823_1 /TAXON_ID=36898 /ORGANISM="Pyramimonas sp., Strain CCMP2087" /LENGTH=288 /DNA_ID=CAMNT_0043894157 /DNA_START=125 /DNA_END=988 /DNA_ORIENTATION=+